MPRAADGTYTLPNPPVIPDALIESTAENTTNVDVADALTDSLSRSGKGGMTAIFKIFDGTISAPGLSYTNEANSGLYRAGAGDVRMSILANDIMRWNAAGASVWTGLVWEQLVTEAPQDTKYYSRIDGVWTVDPAIATNAAAIIVNSGLISDNADAIAVNAANLVTEGARIDTNETDILARLEIDGTNAMTGKLNFGTFQGINLVAGTLATDAVNKAQLDVVDAKADQNASDIAGIGAVTADDLITAQAFDGDNFTSTRVSGNFVTQFKDFLLGVFTTFKSDGAIRHVMNNQGVGAAAINVSTHNRHRVDNQGNLTMTFSGLPTADDPDLGAIYTVEGRVTIKNNASPGTITLAGLTSPTIIGAQNQDANAGQILSYIIDRVSGTNFTTIVWSAE